MELCLSCHSQAYADAQGQQTTANMAEILKDNKYKHGPILEKDCTACHNPHGSDNFRILRAYFPPVFYSPYDPKNYALCFMCHEKDLANTQYTTTMTGFRNGKQNLHYVHVNKTVKGRTCRACHDAHATNNPRHIRDAVPFGRWGLPIDYTKTATGGQCAARLPPAVQVRPRQSGQKPLGSCNRPMMPGIGKSRLAMALLVALLLAGGAWGAPDAGAARPLPGRAWRQRRRPLPRRPGGS